MRYPSSQVQFNLYITTSPSMNSVIHLFQSFLHMRSNLIVFKPSSARSPGLKCEPSSSWPVQTIRINPLPLSESAGQRLEECRVQLTHKNMIVVFGTRVEVRCPRRDRWW